MPIHCRLPTAEIYSKLRLGVRSKVSEGDILKVNQIAALRRDHFPIFEHRTYLNSCSQGALASEVRAAYELYLDQLEEYGSLWETWVGIQEDVRGQLAQVFATQPDQVAITTSASAAVNAIVSSDNVTRVPYHRSDLACPGKERRRSRTYCRGSR